MSKFVTEKSEDGKYVHFHCSFKELRESCYFLSTESFPNKFIINGNSMRELLFKYSIIPYEKYYTKTERLLFEQIETEWQR